MDKFPICREEKAVGELLVEQESLYTWFTARVSSSEEGLWSAWVIGTGGELRLGVLEPEERGAVIRRRFSDRMVLPLGKLLRGEIRPVPTDHFWEPVLRPEELFRTRRLRELLCGQQGVRRNRRENDVRIAIPYDKGKSFPLIDFFCFSELMVINGRTYLVFCFDRKEHIIFGESTDPSSCQSLEKN